MAGVEQRGGGDQLLGDHLRFRVNYMTVLLLPITDNTPAIGKW